MVEAHDKETTEEPVGDQDGVLPAETPLHGAVQRLQEHGHPVVDVCPAVHHVTGRKGNIINDIQPTACHTVHTECHAESTQYMHKATHTHTHTVHTQSTYTVSSVLVPIDLASITMRGFDTSYIPYRGLFSEMQLFMKRL